MPRILLVAVLGAASACTSSVDLSEVTGVAHITVTALDTEANAQGVDIGEAQLSLERLTLVPCDPKAAALGTTDFPVNLLVAPPSSLTIDTAVDAYCTGEVEVAPTMSTRFPKLTGHSVFIAGQRADGADFSVTSDETLRLDFPSMPVGHPFDATRLALGVDFDAWFVDNGVNDAELTDGAAVIDADHNPDLLATFEAATASAISLYRDTNDDGTLTDDELVPVATATAP